MENPAINRQKLFIFVLLLGLSTASAQDMRLDMDADMAPVLPPRKIEAGLFGPLRYGLTNNLEVSAHPLWFFIFPNAEVKWYHGRYLDWDIASLHGFDYPTAFLNLLQREGTGGIISPEFKIPAMFSLYSGIRVSRSFNQLYRVSGQSSLHAGVRFGALPSGSTIDLPLAYYRLAVHYHSYQIRLKAVAARQLFDNWQIKLSNEWFLTPAVSGRNAYEQSGSITWLKSAQTRWSIGYVLVRADYPFGACWHLLLPTVELKKYWQF